MGSESVSGDGNRRNAAFVALARRRSRVALAAVTRADAPLSVAELASRVADSVVAEDAGDGTVERERVALVHDHLPTLDEATLVDWDREDATVTSVDDPAVDGRVFERVLASPDRDWDGAMRALAHERRIVVLAVLDDHGGAIARRNLARRTVARERRIAPADVALGAVEEALTSLHHVHLPKLREAGFVVDDGLETVRPVDDSALDGISPADLSAERVSRLALADP